MTNMKLMTYEEFTDLNIASNLTDFVLYLRDLGIIQLTPYTSIKYIQSTVTKAFQDWLEVAKEELKERNEYIEQFSQDTCSICGESIEKDRARQDENENIICEDCFTEYLASKLEK